MDVPPSLCAADTVFANLRAILRALLGALGAWRIEPVVALMLYRRTSRAMGRIERMLVRFRADRLWRVPHRDVVPGRKLSRTPFARLPHRFGWLVQIGGPQAACVGGQLQAALNTPEMAEFLAASPQAGRILRPLCRALAVQLPGVQPDTARQPDQTQRCRRRPQNVPEPFCIPLPRGVLAAARQQGFGKDR